MWPLSFYRFYGSAAVGIVSGFLLHSIWIGLGTFIGVRALVFFIEWWIKRLLINRDFTSHEAEFKQLYGPYGIRLINKAASDSHIRNGLAEVFVADVGKLRKTVEQLDVMEVLFKAGMQPQGDEFLLHDLKLKYGKHRLIKAGISLDDKPKADPSHAQEKAG